MIGIVYFKEARISGKRYWRIIEYPNYYWIKSKESSILQ